MCSDTWGPHSRDGIADKRNNDTETETHLGLPGHRVSKALSQGLLVVSFQIVSQGLLVSQTAPPPAGGGALHRSSLGPILGSSAAPERPWSPSDEASYQSHNKRMSLTPNLSGAPH